MGHGRTRQMMPRDTLEGDAGPDQGNLLGTSALLVENGQLHRGTGRAQNKVDRLIQRKAGHLFSIHLQDDIPRLESCPLRWRPIDGRNDDELAVPHPHFGANSFKLPLGEAAFLLQHFR